MTNQPKLKFNPSFIFGVYLKRVSSLYCQSQINGNFIFPSCIFNGKKLHVLNSTVSYDALLKQFKSLVHATDTPIGLSKVSLYCCQRISLTKSVFSEADVDVVRKAISVKMVENVHHYATLGFNLLKFV